jgi:3-deoxy-D-manno-octulosonate 8-phosphate phosphatase KdsC-like HAD superfamily phosphatase
MTKYVFSRNVKTGHWEVRDYSGRLIETVAGNKTIKEVCEYLRKLRNQEGPR